MTTDEDDDDPALVKAELVTKSLVETANKQVSTLLDRVLIIYIYTHRALYIVTERVCPYTNAVGIG